MLFLTATTETYRLVTAGAFPTDWAVGYVDLADAGAMPGSAQGSITTATTTTIVTAPASLEQRQVKLITVAVVSEKLKISGSLARIGLRDLVNKGLIRCVAYGAHQGIYTRATNVE